MFKKRILVGCLMFCVLLTGCNKSKEQAPAEETTKNEESTENTQEESAEMVAESENEEAFLPITIEEFSKYGMDPVTYISTGDVTYQKVELSSVGEEKYPALAKALEERNNEQKEMAEFYYQDMNSMIDAFLEESEDSEIPEPLTSMEFTVDTKVYRADKNVLCLLSNEYAYLGGAHPTWDYIGENYDPATGKKLELSDVVLDIDGFYEVVDKKLQEEYYDVVDGLITLEQYRQDLVEYNGKENFAVGYEGITMIFNAYTLGAYASGSQEITIDYDEYPELFADFVKEVPSRYVIPLNGTHYNKIDLDGNGNYEEIYVEQKYVDDHSNTPSLILGKRSAQIADYCYKEESYLININGHYYCYSFLGMENDYNVLHILDLDTMRMRENDGWNLDFTTLSYSSEYEEDYTAYTWKTEPFVNPYQVNLSSRQYMLSTYDGSKTYSILENGELEAKDLFYKTNTGIVLKTKIDVECQEVDEEGNVIAETVLPAGTFVSFLRTDGEKIVDFVIVDSANIEKNGGDEFVYYSLINRNVYKSGDRIYRITSGKDEEYSAAINGIEEFEVFEGILYAG